MTIKETCSCGAVFEVTGDPLNCNYRYNDFLSKHRVCRENVKSTNKQIQADPKPPTSFAEDISRVMDT